MERLIQQSHNRPRFQVFPVMLEPQTAIVEDTYRYTPIRGWRCLQRLCFWLLDKIGCRRRESEVVAYREVTIDTRELMETIRQAAHGTAMMGHISYMVLLGRDELLRLKIECYDRMHQFHLQMSGPRGDGYERIFGLIVVLVPWMNGSRVRYRLVRAFALRVL